MLLKIEVLIYRGGLGLRGGQRAGIAAIGGVRSEQKPPPIRVAKASPSGGPALA